MLLKRKLAPNYIGLIIYCLLSIVFSIAWPSYAAAQDSSAIIKNDSLPFPLKDRRGDFLSGHSNVYDFSLPSNISDSVAYDPVTKTYTVFEKIGNRYYRTPTTYSAEEFRAMEAKKSEIKYFQERANTLNLLNRGRVKPKLSVYDNLFNRLFGNGKVEIQPQGNVDITAGYQGQNVKNPTLPEAARKNGGFDFNMAAQLNVLANIGDKLKFPINYNTLANFDFTNQLKLDYTGTDDEILKKFEAGNITFPLRSTLIPGAQSLFGLKTQLQFGKLSVTGVLANQKSQKQSLNLQGGSAASVFEIKSTEYEENRHFLLAQYFKNNFNKVMSNAPAITTPVQILRLEVWVTNKNGTTTDAREVVGLMDLGESAPYHNFTVTGSVPDNNTNSEYSSIISNPNSRNSSLINNQLTGMGLTPVQDYEKTFARKLDSNQYIYNRRVGFISLSQPLQADEVLAVAFQYSYNGKVYQVGEFSQDVTPDSTSSNQKVLFLKLLKATSQRPQLPIWQLMMKNVYSVGYGSLDPQGFQLNVLYSEPGLGAKRYLPFGDLNQGTPILTLENLDRLNNHNDPQPDGVFDFIEGYTVLSQYSRIIFPLLQPFGRGIASKVFTNAALGADSLYYPLYDSIKTTAKEQFPNLDKFILQGSAKTSASSDISIGYNIPPGSVSVTAGGQQLKENIDYTINYDLGTIKIINQSILASGVPVQVNYENNATFGLQQKSYIGLRLDYLLKNTAKEQLSLGGTIVRLSERPFFTKVDYGEDPIRNTMYGLDGSYNVDMPRLTKILNKIPFYNSTASSSINAYGEAAYLKPGHAPQIGKGGNGVIYIDDFEGSQSNIDLRFPPISWALASTPHGATDQNGAIMFPEADSSNSLAYGKKRAVIAWYQIEPTLQDPKNPNNPLKGDKDLLSDPRVRSISEQEIFPQVSTDFGQNQLITFDLSFYPKDRGPYNFSTSASDINAQGKFLFPQNKWGGLMRSLDQTDFETANIEFIECWVQDPFVLTPNSKGGKFYVNLGNVSEDVLKDSKRFYENGLPTPNLPAKVENSVWGAIPRNPTQVTDAFSNDPNDRPYQDVGFDGLTDSAEVDFRRFDYLNILAANFGTGSKIYQDALADPSADNYHFYRGSDLDTENADILARYKKYNNPQGNSPIADNNAKYSNASTMYPDQEDLNGDNTLNETEEYFQYVVDLKPPTDPEMSVGQNFIVDKKVVGVKLANNTTRNETWYQLRIPIGAYNHKVGNIPDFKSIRFMRMFLTGFQDSVTVRFGELSLVRNTWRKFQYKLDTTGLYKPTSDTTFDVGTVNIEENDKRTPLSYRTPTAIQRVQTLSNNGVTLYQNEQSLSLKFCNLAKNDGKAVFQTYANRDLRQFRQLQLYIHAERNEQTSLNNNDLTGVVRIGSDFVNNYYEIRIPLRLTPLSAGGMDPDTDAYNDSLWEETNNLNISLADLVQLKINRNISDTGLNVLYSQLQSNGQTYSIIGNPNLGQITGILMGVKNTGAASACGEVWFNELRLSSLDEKGGWAALGRLDANLSDLGTVSVSVNTHSNGFGTLDQGINDRFKDNFVQLDAAANLELGKLLPKKAAMSIPFYASFNKATSTPQYDPFDMDITLKQKLKDAPKSDDDSIKNNAISVASIETISFTNVHKNRTSTKKPQLWDVENLDLSYTYTKTKIHTPLLEYNNVIRQQGSLGYNFTPEPKFITPFKKMFKKNKMHWYDLIKDFNINPIPSQLTFKADVFRQFGVVKPRSIGGDKYVTPETFDKYFTFNRNYIVRWDLTHSLSFDYSALNNAVIDEPDGAINTKAKKDTLWHNFFAGGRNTSFNQTINFSYNVPLSKFPLTDWMTLHLDYTAIYNWIGASRIALNLGNFLENGQQENATFQMDFLRLYSKSKWLRALDQPRSSGKETSNQTDSSGAGNKNKSSSKKESELPEVRGALRVLGKLITSIKSVNATVSNTSNTRLPGYMDSTRFLGQDFKSMAPGFDFILGKQPDSNWLNKAAAKGLITRDSLFSDLFVQNYDQKIAVSAQLEPVKDLTIDVNIGKSFSKNYTETFKDTTGSGNNFGHLSPYTSGSFNVTYIAFNTLFEKNDPNRVSKTFLQFQDYREIISQRLGSQNEYNKQAGNPIGADGYALGYGRYSVDALLPAFIAAYTGQDPNTVPLIKQQNPNIKSNPFSGIIPKPNWRITYNGLSRIPGMSKIFSNFSISNAYNASLSMNSYTSALLYQDVNHYNYPSFIDTVSNNYIPFFLVPNITIQEQFAPLVGIDMTFTNQLSVKFDYTKQRQLSLSLIDYQVSEVNSTQATFGGSFRKRGMNLPFKLPFSKTGSKTLENEINFSLDFSIRNNVTSNNILDQNSSFATSGSKQTTISPTISYYINNRINMQLYFTQERITPYISSSAPTVNTRAGVLLRISLAPSPPKTPKVQNQPNQSK